MKELIVFAVGAVVGAVATLLFTSESEELTPIREIKTENNPSIETETKII